MKLLYLLFLLLVCLMQTTAGKGLSRQEYWSGVPLPSPGDMVDDLGAWSREVQVDSSSSDVLNGIISSLRKA